MTEIKHSDENVERAWGLIMGGVGQNEIAKRLRLSRSTTSRVCRAAVARFGTVSDDRFFKKGYDELAQYLFPRMSFGPEDDCWPWRGGVKPNGYGLAHWCEYIDQAHRAVFRAFVGPVGDGEVVEHLCHNRVCVNPRHLRSSKQAVNLLRNASRMDEA